MPIVSSTFTVEHAQTDGRQYVIEQHIDTQGKTYRVSYLAPVGTDYAARLTQTAAALEAQLAEQEFAEVVYGP